jgi:DMSO reductase family type II enzyme heme b subunit
MKGTEVAAQPSAYVRTAWAGKMVGTVRALSVQAANNRQGIYFRLEWRDDTHDSDYGDGSRFPDAAAVLFPLNGDAPLKRMGAPAAGIESWYWRANRGVAGECLSLHGFATEEPRLGLLVETSARWADGRWQVVIGGPLTDKNGPSRVAFAVWDGASQERAGLHSYSPEWLDLAVR